MVEAFDANPNVKTSPAMSAGRRPAGLKAAWGWLKTRLTRPSRQQVGPVELSDKIKNGKAQGDVVFQKRTSLVFKKLQVVRFYDAKRNTLAYLAYSDKVVEGSPKNAISAVPIMPWH
ncbi:CreA family protein [Enterobacter hormaechei]